MPGGPWPVVADLSSETPLLVEEWTMTVSRDPAKEDLFAFTLRGSKTGPDGSGRSDTRCLSPSGRVVTGDVSALAAVRVYSPRQFPTNEARAPRRW